MKKAPPKKATQETTVVVKRVAFVHGFNEYFEYYAHTDKQGWNWQLWRHLQGSEAKQQIWHASVDQPGTTGAMQMLNNLTRLADGREQRDPLCHIDCHDHEKLLRGLVGLIRKGEWPREKTVKPLPPRPKQARALG